MHFTQRSIGAQQSGGFRLVTDNVVDGSDLVLPRDKEQLEVGIVARCCVERCPDFTAAKASYALAVVLRAAQLAKKVGLQQGYFIDLREVDADDGRPWDLKSPEKRAQIENNKRR